MLKPDSLTCSLVELQGVNPSAHSLRTAQVTWALTMELSFAVKTDPGHQLCEDAAVGSKYLKYCGLATSPEQMRYYA